MIVIARMELPSASRLAGAVLMRLATMVVLSASVPELLPIYIGASAEPCHLMSVQTGYKVDTLADSRRSRVP